MNIINNQPMQERTGPEGKEIFTQIFTALLPREHHEHQEGEPFDDRQVVGGC